MRLRYLEAMRSINKPRNSRLRSLKPWIGTFWKRSENGLRSHVLAAIVFLPAPTFNRLGAAPLVLLAPGSA